MHAAIVMALHTTGVLGGEPSRSAIVAAAVLGVVVGVAVLRRAVRRDEGRRPSVAD